MKFIFSFSILFFIGKICNAQLNITPHPVEVKLMPGECIIKEPVGFILFDENFKDQRDGLSLFKKYLTKKYGIKNFKDGDTHSYGLPMEFLYNSFDDEHQEGYYEIEVTKNQVYIHGNTAGNFYAYETLKQLIRRNKKGQLVIPHCIIKDYPRFTYRGMHLDVARHFFTVAEVKKYIDHLAAYKFNTFHWHLTDDQGWRIEIKKYPRLAQIGGCRAQTLIGPYGSNKYDSTKYCGYYTQAQIKEVVQYATERRINIIPEIEMPGHALAALSAYPYLGCTKGPYKAMETWGVSDEVFCAGNDSTYVFMQNVLNEVIQLFPSTYIHIGGDECPHERWKNCPVCMKRMKSENLKNENELQGYFIKRMQQFLAKKGKKIIGWDEIIDDANIPGATIMSWRGEEGGIKAAKNGNDVIMTPGNYCYFDHAQSKNEDSVTFGGYVPLENVYGYEPVPAGLSAAQGKHILGAQGNVWTEYITNEKKLEYTIFPRMAALAEVLWSPKEKRNWKNFEERLPAIFAGYEKQKLNYSKAYYEPSIELLPSENANGIYIKVKSRQPKATYYFGNKTKSAFALYNDSINTFIDQSGTYGIRMLGKLRSAGDGEKWGLTVTNDFELLFKKDLEISFNKATGKNISLTTPPSPSYAGSGAFTLVNGIQNTKGMSKSSEFLGFYGKDLEAVIDLGEETAISKVSLHVFQQNASWIYLPASVNIFVSNDGADFSKAYLCLPDSKTTASVQYISTEKLKGRFVKIVAKNYGVIPSGQPGADNPAWLFADEVEIF